MHFKAKTSIGGTGFQNEISSVLFNKKCSIHTPDMFSKKPQTSLEICTFRFSNEQPQEWAMYINLW